MVEEAPGDEAGLEALRQAGRRWPNEDHAATGRTGITSELVIRSEHTGSHPGDRYVRFERAGNGAFRPAGPGTLRATAAVPRAQEPLGRVAVTVKEKVVGDPLATERAGHERLTKVKALAVLSSDAISSNAYATGAMLSVLLAAGTANFGLSIGIATAIAILFAMVILSYRQTIKAYPMGGGSYIVAGDNLGSLAGLVAASSLMIDYVLTVAVSVVSGVAALTSMSPELSPYALSLDVGLVLVILVGNLRGVRQSGTIFMLPSYMFITGVYAMIIVGTVKLLGGGVHIHAPVKMVPATEALSVFLVLRAFASGCTALTGIEAISDGVPAFQPPESRNARTTITTLGALAISMFLGITLLVHAFGLVPNPGDAYPTLISLLNRATLGSGIGYYYVQLTTALILMLAANTAFSDFPRLAYFLARDDFLPHRFTLRGDRLSYSNGILVLGALAISLILVFRGSFAALINLYVIGVFASFTLSQSGMVRRWLARREPGWRKGLLLNGSGAMLTFVVLVITAVTKFVYGAWLVVLLVPIMVITFYRIRAHYRRSAEMLRPRAVTPPDGIRHTVLLHGFDDEGSLAAALAYIRTLRVARVILVRPRGSSPSAKVDPGIGLPVEEYTSDGQNARGALRAAISAVKRGSPEEIITVILPPVKSGVRRRLFRRYTHNAILRRHKVAVAQLSRCLPAENSGPRHRALVSVDKLDLAGLEALTYACSLVTGRVFGVHVAADEHPEQARREWEAWGNHLPLVTIDAPYRAIVPPLRAYIDALDRADGGETITLVLPLVFASGMLGRILHNHTAHRLRHLLLKRPNTVVVSVPHHLP